MPLVPQFAHGRESLPFILPATPTAATIALAAGTAIVQVGTGGSTTASRTLYLSLQGENPVGYNLPTMVQVTIAAGQQATITLPVELPQPGEFWDAYTIGASLTSDPTTIVQLARVPRSGLVLPFTLTLSRDEHFALSTTVAHPGVLPTGANLVPGMRRGVSRSGAGTSDPILGFVYEYDPTSAAAIDNRIVLSATPGRWLRALDFRTGVEDTTDPGGCAQDIRTINEAVVRTPRYACTGAAGTPRTFWLTNTGTDAIPSGQRVIINVAIGELPRSGLFEGLLSVRFRGYANLANGFLQTDDADDRPFLGLDTPVSFENKKTDLVFQADLEPDHAFAVEITPQFDASHLNNEVAQLDIVRIFCTVASQTGAYSEAGDVLGDRIYPQYDLGRVIPQRGGMVKVLKRSGMVGSRSFRAVAPTLIAGLTTDGLNQEIRINGSGTAFLGEDAILDSEAVRAFVDCLAGEGNPSPWSSATTLTAGVGVSVTVNYQSVGGLQIPMIREDYPDPLLAGLAAEQITASAVNVYVKIGSTIKKFANLPISPDALSDTHTLTNWSGATTVTSLPTAPSSDFGFWKASGALITNSGAGSFPTGSAQVAYAFVYNGTTPSRISHAASRGCIPTGAIDLSEMEEAAKYWAPGVADVAALRAISYATIAAYQSRFVASANTVYHFVPGSTFGDTGESDASVVKPFDLSGGSPGRWVRDDSNAIVFLGEAPTSSFGDVGDVGIVLNSAIAEHGNLYKQTSLTTWALQGNLRGIQGTAGTGNRWFTGAGAPSSGSGSGSTTGDLWLNTNNGDVYRKSSPTVWSSSPEANIRGVAGTAGANGRAGAQWLYGAGTPEATITLPVQGGDFYLNTSNGDAYVLTTAGGGISSTFTSTLLVNLRGAAGATGSVSAASALKLTQQSVLPTTAASEIAIVNFNGAVRFRLASNGTSLVPLIAGRQTVPVPAAAMLPTPTNGCSALATVQIAANQPCFRHLAFDPSTAQSAQFEVRLPKAWNLGTIRAQFEWTGVVAGAGDVVWGIQAVAQSDGDAIGVAYGTAVTVTDTFISTNTRHITAETAAFTVAGSPAVGDVVCFQVYRDAANGADTRASAANLTGVTLYITTDKENDA